MRDPFARIGKMSLLTVVAILTLIAPLRVTAQGTPTAAVDSVVMDLERSIPDLMGRANTPGLAVALIRHHQILWERGFGVATSITRSAVTSETVFPVASLGKPIAAYAFLRLAARGIVELDSPLGAQLSMNWIPAPGRDVITPRHLLTHTSGLSNFLGDKARQTRFAPAERFSYSGVGFMYLQRALEERAGSLDSAAKAEVFDPLGMNHSSFVSRDLGPRAYGHVRADRAVAPFGIIFVPAAAMLALVALVGIRLARGTWLLARWTWLLVAAGATCATLCFLYSRAANPRLVPYFTASFALLVAISVTIERVMFLLTMRMRSSGSRTSAWQHVVGTAIAAAVLLVTFGSARVPIPDAAPPEGNAASSLRATAGDLARFLIEIAHPTMLPTGLASEVTKAQVRVNEQVSWGLGISLQTTAGARAVFHWGRNPSLRAAMVYYPDSGDGVVVLTNDAYAHDVVEAIVLRAIGGPRFWADQ